MTVTAWILAGVTVVLPMEARVEGTEMRLGDVASVVGASLDEVRLVESVSLGYAPAPGYNRLLLRHRIAESVAREAPGVAVRFDGEPSTRVWPEVVTVTADRIRSVAAAALEERLADEDATLALEHELANLAVPGGDAPPALRVRPMDPSSLGSRVSVPVEIVVDGSVYRTVWATFRVEVWDTIVVPRRPIRAGEAIHAADLVRDRVPRSDRPALTASLLHGAVAARDLPAGAPVTSNDVHRPTVVERGDTIYLEVVKGPIRARVAAVALEPGAIGDRIRVANQGSGKESAAVVVARDLCELDLDARL